MTSVAPILRILLLGVGYWVLGIGIASAQSPRIDRTRAWVTAAITHAPGEVDAGVLQVRDWTATDLTDLRDHIRSVLRLMVRPQTSRFTREVNRAIPTPIGYTDPEVDALRVVARDALERVDHNQLLRRGAVLHTTIAMHAPPEARTSGGGAAAFEHRTFFLSDGRTIAEGSAADHWEIARTLLEMITSDPRGDRRAPESDPFVRDWYAATGRVLLGAGKLWWPHFDRALELFPDDADLLFLDGALHETFASSHIQQAVSAARSADDRFAYRSSVGSPRDELRRAASRLQDAVDAEPSHLEARIHLGRVLTTLDRDGEALPILQAAARDARDPPDRYYALLFLGAAADAAGNIALARRSYQDASALYPTAQSPRLALGDGVGLFALPRDERAREDPWQVYYESAGRGAASHLARLFERLTAGDRR